MKITNQISAKRRSKRRSSTVKRQYVNLPKSTSAKKRSNAGKIAGITLGSIAAGSLVTFGVVKGCQAVKSKYDRTVADIEDKSQKLVNAAKIEAKNNADAVSAEFKVKIKDLESEFNTERGKLQSRLDAVEATQAKAAGDDVPSEEMIEYTDPSQKKQVVAKTEVLSMH